MSFPSIEQSGYRNQLLAKLRQHMSLYGYQSVDLPFIEEADLFLTRAGDQIINQLFTFERFSKQLSLRPEFTAAAVYRYGNIAADKATVRWQFNGPVFVDSEEHATNHYQSYSIGAELIGMGGAVLDAEMIVMAAGGLRKLSIDDFRLVMGHIGLMRHLLSYFSLDKRTERFLLHHLMAFNRPEYGKDYILQKVEHALLGKYHPKDQQNDSASPKDDHLAEADTVKLLDSLLDSDNRGTTMGGRTRQDIARRLVQKQKRANELPQIIEALNFLERWSQVNTTPDEAFPMIQGFIQAGDAVGSRLLAEWQMIVSILERHGIDQIRISAALSRDWDYYTGNVFEIQSAMGKNLAGGGRYDELVSLICGKDAPAVGFAYAVDEILKIVPAPTEFQKTLTLTYTEQTSLHAINWAMLIRQHAIPVQLLPQPASESIYPPLAHVDEDGQLVFEGRNYHIEHPGTFISDFQGSTI